MAVDKTRRMILDLIATPGQDTRYGSSYLPASVRQASGCASHEVWEAIYSLIADGLIYLDPSGQDNAGTQHNYRWKLSSKGIRVISGGPWEPDDPEGYLLRLRRTTPDLDPIALRYVQEALGAFNARCYLACSVVLGVASEAAFNGLAEAYADTLTGSSAARARTDMTAPYRAVSTRWDSLRKRLDPIREGLPEGLGDRLLLDAIGDVLRVARNDVGHPSGRVIDEETARAHLVVAGTYLSKMTALRRHFEQQKPTEDGADQAEPH